MTSLDIQKLNKAYQCTGGTSCRDQNRYCRFYRRWCSRSSYIRRICNKTCNVC
uniref:Zinc metalloproteinase nas13like [Hydra vulgaris] n=3 Tax=Lepeophtheirus salmonis TaxID=72036 RepID=A0A0K2VIF9_LEPSM